MENEGLRDCYYISTSLFLNRIANIQNERNPIPLLTAFLKLPKSLLYGTILQHPPRPFLRCLVWLACLNVLPEDTSTWPVEIDNINVRYCALYEREVFSRARMIDCSPDALKCDTDNETDSAEDSAITPNQQHPETNSQEAIEKTVAQLQAIDSLSTADETRLEATRKKIMSMLASLKDGGNEQQSQQLTNENSKNDNNNSSSAPSSGVSNNMYVKMIEKALKKHGSGPIQLTKGQTFIIGGEKLAHSTMFNTNQGHSSSPLMCGTISTYGKSSYITSYQFSYERENLFYLRRIIKKDTQRLFTESPFFVRTGTRSSIMDVITLYCLLNTRNHVDYKQGIHEIAGILFQVAVNAIEDASALLEGINTTTHINDADLKTLATINALAHSTPEPLSYFMLVAVMGAACGVGMLFCDETGDYFYNGHENSNNTEDVQNTASTNAGLNNTSSNGNLVQWTQSILEPHPDQIDGKKHQKTVKCTYYTLPKTFTLASHLYRVFDVLLPSVDFPLAQHLKNSKIERLFALRWLRLLFIRELPLDLIPRLWDFVFVDAKVFYPHHFFDSMVLVVLQTLREKIMRSNESELMAVLAGPALDWITSRLDIERIAVRALAKTCPVTINPVLAFKILDFNNQGIRIQDPSFSTPKENSQNPLAITKSSIASKEEIDSVTQEKKIDDITQFIRNELVESYSVTDFQGLQAAKNRLLTRQQPGNINQCDSLSLDSEQQQLQDSEAMQHLQQKLVEEQERVSETYGKLTAMSMFTNVLAKKLDNMVSLGEETFASLKLHHSNLHSYAVRNICSQTNAAQNQSSTQQQLSAAVPIPQKQQLSATQLLKDEGEYMGNFSRVLMEMRFLSDVCESVNTKGIKILENDPRMEFFLKSSYKTDQMLYNPQSGQNEQNDQKTEQNEQQDMTTPFFLAIMADYEHMSMRILEADEKNKELKKRCETLENEVNYLKSTNIELSANKQPQKPELPIQAGKVNPATTQNANLTSYFGAPQNKNPQYSQPTPIINNIAVPHKIEKLSINQSDFEGPILKNSLTSSNSQDNVNSNQTSGEESAVLNQMTSNFVDDSKKKAKRVRTGPRFI